MRAATILHADDNSTAHALVKYVLESIGHQVLQAKNGDEVLDLAIHKRPDVLLLDWIMPQLGGPALLIEVLQSRPDTRDIPIIMLATEQEKTKVKAARQLGVRVFLTNSHPFGSARSSPGREAAKRTLDGEDRSGIIRGEGKGGRL